MIHSSFARLVSISAGLLFLLASCSGIIKNENGEINKPELAITGITDNRLEYPSGEIPAYSKYEITFQVENSTAGNYYFSYDSKPPAGIDPGNPAYQGISVDAIFSADDWKTTYRQPAFYFQEFEEQIIRNKDWIYPTGQYAWKVRFSPNTPGEWQVKILAQDSRGSTESESIQFSVVQSASKGFIRTSQRDVRYFEFDDGTYFPGLGFNLTSSLSLWENPLQYGQPFFQKMKQNGISLLRLWLTPASIYGSAWNPWHGVVDIPAPTYIPFTGLSTEKTYSAAGSETSMIVNARRNPCMFIGWQNPIVNVKPGATYRIRVRYLTELIADPVDPNQPYGLVLKIGEREGGGWLWGDGNDCNLSGTGIVVSGHQSTNTIIQEQPWQILEGTWTAGQAPQQPYLYITMENVASGRAHIDHVWVEEDLGSGIFGPNILAKPWMSHHLYINQQEALAFDQILSLAEENDVYLKLVLLEKEDWVFNRIQPDGRFDDNLPLNDNFYGPTRQLTKVRWLQQAWWRYVQARWGYSPNIHSWELLNEGDPGSLLHYAFADDFAKYMRCTVFGIPVGSGDAQACLFKHPNRHMVTTSFWHTYPVRAFWANGLYPNLNYIDLHAYVSTGWINDQKVEFDAAGYHLAYSAATRRSLDAALIGRRGLPIMRGEAGLDNQNQLEWVDLQNDKNGVWLHNFLWSTLDTDALYELYWWNNNIFNQPGPDGEPGLFEIYSYLAQFLSDIPLNNGQYTNAEPEIFGSRLRAIGQKDTTNLRAHLWIQNTAHTWRNVIDGRPNTRGLSGSVSITGFPPGIELPVLWVEFTTQGSPSLRTESLMVNSDGIIKLTLPEDTDLTDIAVKIGDYP